VSQLLVLLVPIAVTLVLRPAAPTTSRSTRAKVFSQGDDTYRVDVYFH